MGRQTDEDYIKDQECPTDDELLYRTKQYLTLNQVMDVLIDIENGVLKDIPDPSVYLVDIFLTLRDLYSGTPTDLTLQVFKPEKKVYAIVNSVGLTQNYTILHRYNDFIMKEYPVLADSDRRSRAGMIREVIAPMGRNLMGVLSSYCSNLGIIKSIE